MKGPSLTADKAGLYRMSTDVDIEGTPIRVYTLVREFRCGFGSLTSTPKPVLGHDGQRVDAALSTTTKLNAITGDKVTVKGQDWLVIGVIHTAITTRLLLAAWGKQA
jgi:hypothetical protein